jgi:hypothetical protein
MYTVYTGLVLLALIWGLVVVATIALTYHRVSEFR